MWGIEVIALTKSEVSKEKEYGKAIETCSCDNVGIRLTVKSGFVLGCCTSCHALTLHSADPSRGGTLFLFDL